MGVNKLFWCNNCQTFDTLEDAELINRPNGWSRIEVQSSARGAEVMHFCAACAEKIRDALAIFFKRRPQ